MQLHTNISDFYLQLTRSQLGLGCIYRGQISRIEGCNAVIDVGLRKIEFRAQLSELELCILKRGNCLAKGLTLLYIIEGQVFFLQKNALPTCIFFNSIFPLIWATPSQRCLRTHVGVCA